MVHKGIKVVLQDIATDRLYRYAGSVKVKTKIKCGVRRISVCACMHAWKKLQNIYAQRLWSGVAMEKLRQICCATFSDSREM